MKNGTQRALRSILSAFLRGVDRAVTGFMPQTLM